MASNLSVFPGGAAGTCFLWIYKLDWPPCQESFTALHPEGGKSHREEKGRLLSYLFTSTQCLFISRLLFSDRPLRRQLHWPRVHTAARSSLPQREVPGLRNQRHLPRILLHEPRGVCGFITAANPQIKCCLKYFPLKLFINLWFLNTKVNTPSHCAVLCVDTLLNDGTFLQVKAAFFLIKTSFSNKLLWYYLQHRMTNLYCNMPFPVLHSQLKQWGVSVPHVLIRGSVVRLRTPAVNALSKIHWNFFQTTKATSCEHRRY